MSKSGAVRIIVIILAFRASRVCVASCILSVRGSSVSQGARERRGQGAVHTTACPPSSQVSMLRDAVQPVPALAELTL